MSAILTVDPQEVSTGVFHKYLLGTVAPRPIALASTMDVEGQINLSPFSFFNAFSAKPPILIFSPARRVRDNTTKHTLENALETKEVVINICNFDMAEQMSLSSSEYARGVNEFEKGGFTMVDSEKVNPPRVGESPASFECKVKDIVSLGKEGGAGNLIICEVVLAHIQKSILDNEGKVDPIKLDAIARMGENWYARANAQSLFEISKPLTKLGIGVDALPAHIRLSKILSGNDLGKLGNVEALPALEEITSFAASSMMQQVREECEGDKNQWVKALHHLAKEQLAAGQVEVAWKILMQKL